MPNYALTLAALCTVFALAAVHLIERGTEPSAEAAPVIEPTETEPPKAEPTRVAAPPAPKRARRSRLRLLGRREMSRSAREIEQYRGPDAPPLVRSLDPDEVRTHEDRRTDRPR